MPHSGNNSREGAGSAELLPLCGNNSREGAGSAKLLPGEERALFRERHDGVSVSPDARLSRAAALARPRLTVTPPFNALRDLPALDVKHDFARVDSL